MKARSSTELGCGRAESVCPCMRCLPAYSRASPFTPAGGEPQSGGERAVQPNLNEFSCEGFLVPELDQTPQKGEMFFLCPNESCGLCPPAQQWPGTPSSSQHSHRHSYTQGQIFIYRAAVQQIQTLSQEKRASLLQGTAAVGRTHHPDKEYRILHGEGLALPEHEHASPVSCRKSPQKSGWRTACALPSVLPQLKAARWACQGKDGSCA